MLRYLISWYNRRTSNFYWYAVELTYKDKSGRMQYTQSAELGVAHKARVLNHRYLKKLFIPAHKNPAAVAHLCNGTMVIKIVGYLGYFRKDDQHKL